MLNQQISATGFSRPEALVNWMCCMQAQDYAMVRWAIGSRLPDSTDRIVQTSMDEGKIFRTHLLRPTWHLVSAEDIYWVLELTAPQIKTSMKSRNIELELTETVINKSNKLIKEILSGDRNLTREEIALSLEKINIKTNNNRLSHLLQCAELDGLICSGKSKGNKYTYALLEERVKKPQSISKDTALEKLADKYFFSHGPATLHDFVWWSGLAVKDARNAIEMVNDRFISETLGPETYWLSGSSVNIKAEHSLPCLLPAFDEFLISYRDRAASLSDLHKKVISDNGIFRPVIVLDGQVIGIWKRVIKKNVVSIETRFIESISKAKMDQVEWVAEKFGRFLNCKAEVKHHRSNEAFNNPKIL